MTQLILDPDHRPGQTRGRVPTLPPICSRPFTPAEAARDGHGRAVLERWVREGLVVRLLRGAYLAASVPVTASVRAAAVAQLLAPGRRAVGRTAAWLYGCPAGALTLGADDGCVIPMETEACRGPGAEMLGVPVSTAVRTAVDLARRLPAPAALAVLDGLLRGGALRHTDLVREIPPDLCELAARADTRSRGPAESVLRCHWLDTRLPTPTPGLCVEGRRLALALPWQRFGVVIVPGPTARPASEPEVPGWWVSALAEEKVLRTAAEQVRFHLEREYHQHLLGQMVRGP